MEKVSQIILRNLARLPDGPLLLINPPRDGLAQQLGADGRALRCFTQDFGDYRWLQAAGVDVEFGVVPAVESSDRLAILFLPREKERLAMMLHAIADRLPPQCPLWLVGENRGGIKSSPRQLECFFSRVAVLDNARHCGLVEASTPSSERSFDVADYVSRWSTTYAGREIALRSLPGVFAHGRLDTGTALLLGVLEGLQPNGRILDFACGCGVVGAALLAHSPSASLTLLDSSALAIESSRQSLEANGLEAELLASDGLSEVDGRFDWIVSNPPFHRGVSNDLEVAAGFLRTAGTFLAENGRIVVVFNRHLPYSRWLDQPFGKVERLAETGEYIVVQASRPVGNR
jgi:16S rRNA (guanine1207-N2)-methyltransferase